MITVAVAATVALAASPYFDLIGVGCVPWKPDGSSLAWRPEFPGIPATESMRVFKALEGDDTRRCLALIVEADKTLAARARDLRPKTAPATYREVISGIHRQWTAFGVGEALEEVAKSGQRGPKTEAFLSRCRELEQSASGGNDDRE